MKVILKQDVRKVGRKDEIKEVSDGYANNFLFPKKLAEYATPEKIKKLEKLKSLNLAEIEIKEKLAEAELKALQGIVVYLKRKASDKGHLFESVHPEEISLALKEQTKIDLDQNFISIEKPIKTIGEHQISVLIGKNKGGFKLVVETL